MQYQHSMPPTDTSGTGGGQSLCFSAHPCRFSRMNNKLRFTVKDHVDLAVTQCFWKKITFYTLHFQEKKKIQLSIETKGEAGSLNHSSPLQV